MRDNTGYPTGSVQRHEVGHVRSVNTDRADLHLGIKQPVFRRDARHLGQAITDRLHLRLESVSDLLSHLLFGIHARSFA
ncbi:MAG: hypothetical protein JWL76_2009 [Thermoleophilia bacterium]|nr:hypothetical protein [Thermoleophilia bacterium]